MSFRGGSREIFARNLNERFLPSVEMTENALPCDSDTAAYAGMTEKAVYGLLANASLPNAQCAMINAQ
jgi:hypothetical protein